MVNLLLLVVPLILSTVSAKLNVVHEWKYIDFVWKDSWQKQQAIASGAYNFTQIFTIDVDQSRGGRVFVTTPRQSGVPATLSTVSEKYGGGGPLLKPYPSWSWNTRNDCKGIISVYRVTIDDCDRLWVLDTGKNGETQMCPAQLLAFNLRDDKLIRRIVIPSDRAENAENGKSLLITPVVETHGESCERTRIYMADVDGYGLVVSDGRNLRRYNDVSFNPDPNNTNFTIAGESFHLEDGLFSLAIEPRTHYSRSTRLFYRPLASLKQYTVSTRHFDEYSNAMRPNYKTLDYTFPTQVSVQAFSRGGTLFMGYVNPPAIACWNSHKPMNSQNVVIVARNEETLQFTSGLKVRGDTLMVFTNRFQKIMSGTQNFGEINFRILKEDNIHNLVRGTACQ